MTRATSWCVLLALAAALAACGGGPDKVGTEPAAAAAPASLRVTSTAFAPNGRIPARYSCTGEGARPPLRFGGVPRRASELALVVIDPDAGGFVHWTVYGMQPGARGIAARGLPPGAREGVSSTGETGWTPPCPPSGTHRYRFELYWLRSRSGLAAGAEPQDVVDAIRSRAGGRGLLVGRFGRP
jgi:Raf kinase inhibitor-like YbhB/YbcL family protein